MRIALFACSVVFCGMFSVCFAGEKENQAAKDFKFEGVSFSTSLDQFKRMYPGARRGQDTDEKLGVEQYLLSSEVASLVSFHFFDGNLYEMRILYDVQKVNKIGGDEVLLTRLQDKFGTPDADSPGVIKKEPFEFRMEWSMKDAHRFVVMRGEAKFTRIDVIDTEVNTKMVKKKRKLADTGF